MQTDTISASTIYINSGAFPGSPFHADLYRFPQSGFPAVLVLDPPNMPAPTLMA